ncbi:MAG TPA: DUF302 domain-containing protein [Candidatus Acidoferrales bacterium]|nr:DUF302 domain-containing protein [Candidatus Acidoferrales bacterium]
MANFMYIVESAKRFDDTVKAIEQETAKKGFRVLHTHDVAATLREKGFQREPMKIIEICNARYANEALSKDIRLAVMLPCPICVYDQGGKTFVNAFRPTAMDSFFPEAGIESLSAQVEKAVVDIVNAAK